jgi:two-component system chemotaxis sensor kinase CheA
MAVADQEFQQKLLATFREEASEHLKAISAGLIDLEKSPPAELHAQIVETIFREAHSLKGAARAVNLKEIEKICQSLEGTFSRAKRGEIELGPDVLDVMHRETDEIEHILQSSAHERAAGAPESPDPGRKLTVPGAAPRASEGPPPAAPGLDMPRPAAEETVRVSADMLDRLLLQVEELVPASMAIGHRSAELQELWRDSTEWRHEWGRMQLAARSVRESLERDAAAKDKRSLAERKLLEFLEWNEEYSRRMETRLSVLTKSGARDQHSLGTMVGSLLKDTKLLLLRPFSSITDAYPKIVRDLCHEREKEASLVVRGSEIEIDRRILQEIKDPCLHLLRNCIDHGIETPQERGRIGKTPRGAISIAIEQVNANRVEVTISDDGAGIDPRKVREAVVKSGLLDYVAAQEINDVDMLSYIFQSGVTTSPIVTDLSGRGLGMAIVREKVERLGGEVILDTGPGKGTTFRLLLPLTVSTVRGLLVRVAQQSFVIPITFVERVAMTRLDAVRTVENRATVLLGDRPVSFVRLREVLDMPPDLSTDQALPNAPIVVLATADKRIACQVDEIIGEQELLVKSLGPQLARVRNIGGAAVLGTGKVVPILNVADVVKSAVKATARSAPEGKAETQKPDRQRAVLVVDDSITARTLLKTILESAGYLVRTAVDGAEAFATLRETKFDVVVSDVDMPRLNGFDLTARIRGDRKLAELPVILVTALESRQDRERGIDVGANAYIVKSSFAQSNLLEVVHRYA